MTGEKGRGTESEREKLIGSERKKDTEWVCLGGRKPDEGSLV